MKLTFSCSGAHEQSLAAQLKVLSTFDANIIMIMAALNFQGLSCDDTVTRCYRVCTYTELPSRLNIRHAENIIIQLKAATLWSGMPAPFFVKCLLISMEAAAVFGIVSHHAA